MKKVICIMQARMGSSRLPGKVLMDLCGKSVLEHQINRLKKVNVINEIIVATTTKKEDLIIVKEAKKLGVQYFIGDEKNVLSRYYNAAKTYSGEVIVRVTSDCPCMDNNLIEKIIEKFIKLDELKEIDYVSNTLKRTFPRGYDVEVFSFEALENAYKYAVLSYEKEHVTPFIYNNKQSFKVKNFENDLDYSMFRVTLDTKEDFKVIEAIYNELYKKNSNFSYKEVIDFLIKNPDIYKINQEVKQKTLGE